MRAGNLPKQESFNFSCTQCKPFSLFLCRMRQGKNNHAVQAFLFISLPLAARKKQPRSASLSLYFSAAYGKGKSFRPFSSLFPRSKFPTRFVPFLQFFVSTQCEQETTPNRSLLISLILSLHFSAACGKEKTTTQCKPFSLFLCRLRQGKNVHAVHAGNQESTCKSTTSLPQHL